MSNIIGFKIDLNGHVTITYIAANGMRETFDLTKCIEELMAKGIGENSVSSDVAAHERKFHGHQL